MQSNLTSPKAWFKSISPSSFKSTAFSTLFYVSRFYFVPAGELQVSMVFFFHFRRVKESENRSTAIKGRLSSSILNCQQLSPLRPHQSLTFHLKLKYLFPKLSVYFLICDKYNKWNMLLFETNSTSIQTFQSKIKQGGGRGKLSISFC